MGETPQLLDYETASTRLGTTPRHLRRLVTERRIPFVKVGRFVRFDPADLDAYIAANRTEALR